MVKQVPILVVDDEHDHAVFIEDTLRETEIPLLVHKVESGEEAISYLAGEGRFADRDTYPMPFLVLLDLRMPGIGGFGVLRWLGDHPDLKKEVNLIVLSSVQSMKEIEVVYELGAHFFWSKSDSRAIKERVQLLKETWLEQQLEGCH